MAQGACLDAKTRINGFDLVAEEPCQSRRVAIGPRRADADGLMRVIDPMKEQIETPRAEVLGFEHFTKLAGELAGIAGNGLGRTDRLGKTRLASMSSGGRTGSIGSLSSPIA